MENFSKQIVEFYERLSSWENDVVKGTGISLQQMHTIEVLGNNRNIRMKDLALKLGISTGTLTVMIKRLEKMSLVERKKNPEDGRSYTLCLTENGEELYQEHHTLHLTLSQQIGENLSEDEVTLFSALLHKIIDAI